MCALELQWVDSLVRARLRVLVATRSMDSGLPRAGNGARATSDATCNYVHGGAVQSIRARRCDA